jgi:phenylalanyl-tRNA synthetase alpha chain
MTFDSQALQKALTDLQNNLPQVKTLAELEKLKKDFLGENSIVAASSKAIGQLEPNKRSEAGKVLSAVKTQFEQFCTPVFEKLQKSENANKLENERVDITLPTNIHPLGSRHPLHILEEDIANFFKNIGWRIADGPEIEAEWFNFDALNFGVDHPARQMQDTFYLTDQNQVLRTHTSPVQVRSLLENGVPLFIACPGRVFRTDELDATHTPVFHQCEGLAVAKGLTMAHLKGTIDAFAKAMFGSATKTRLRPSYFPFTEPSAEMDIWYEHKKGGAGWIEWGGCGMVNPNVLRSCGIDPEVYTGFAFGMGLERTLMFRHEISDMHDIVEGDIDFSQQFGITSNGGA